MTRLGVDVSLDLKPLAVPVPLHLLHVGAEQKFPETLSQPQGEGRWPIGDSRPRRRSSQPRGLRRPVASPVPHQSASGRGPPLPSLQSRRSCHSDRSGRCVAISSVSSSSMNMETPSPLMHSNQTREGEETNNQLITASQRTSSRLYSRSAEMRLISSHSEVYEPCDDSFALVDALLADRMKLLEHHPSLCLEIGSGSGYVITSLAIMLNELGSGVHYFATDINPHAVETTKSTLGAHGVEAEVIATDIASGLERRLAGMVDVIVVNPPYVPTPEEEVGRDGITASWAGGENGRTVIDRILPVVDKLLSEKGWLYMVTLTANNPSQICRLMRDKGYASRIVVQRSTEEESLHIIKFWHDGEAAVEGHKSLAGTDSWLSHLPIFSFWKNSGNNCGL